MKRVSVVINRFIFMRFKIFILRSEKIYFDSLHLWGFFISSNQSILNFICRFTINYSREIMIIQRLLQGVSCLSIGFKYLCGISWPRFSFIFRFLNSFSMARETSLPRDFKKNFRLNLSNWEVKIIKSRWDFNIEVVSMRCHRGV